MSTAESTPEVSLSIGRPPGPTLRRLAEFEPPIERPGHPAWVPTAGEPAWPAPAAPAAPPAPSRPGTDEMAALACARTTLRSLMEVLDGRRPLLHLQPLFHQRAYQRTETVVRQIRRRRASATRPSAARLRSLRACHPVPRVAEVSAVWELDGQPRALAARFEDHHRRGPAEWRCTALLLG